MTRPHLALALALTALLPACGDSGTSPDPTPSATPATTLLFQSAFPRLEPFQFVFTTFSVPTAGTVRATMDWTFTTNTMHLYVFEGSTCTDFPSVLVTGGAPGCTVLGRHVVPGVKHGEFSFRVAALQEIRVLVGNEGPTSEAGIVQITHTP